jgi:hypothetical protein
MFLLWVFSTPSSNRSSPHGIVIFLPFPRLTPLANNSHWKDDGDGLTTRKASVVAATTTTNNKQQQLREIIVCQVLFLKTILPKIVKQQ